MNATELQLLSWATATHADSFGLQLGRQVSVSSMPTPHKQKPTHSACWTECQRRARCAQRSPVSVPGSPEEWSCLWSASGGEVPCSAAEYSPVVPQSPSDALVADLPSEDKAGIWEAELTTWEQTKSLLPIQSFCETKLNSGYKY